MNKRLRVFDDNSNCFRDLDPTNYNDDVVVGSVFFRREALSVIKKYYGVCGYYLVDTNNMHYPIDIHENEIVLLEGTYNCLSDSIKDELIDYNMDERPEMIWSSFFFRWQFLADSSVFLDEDPFIRLCSLLLRNEIMLNKMLTEKIDIVFPSDYRELSQFAQNVNSLTCVDLFNKEYFEEFNYLFDTLLNGYHINMTSNEIKTYCYHICKHVCDAFGREDV